MSNSQRPDDGIFVLGAGIVGICTALYLQRDGHQVTLLDRQEPARGCSFGNGGMIQCSSVVPVAAFARLRTVPRMLVDKDQPLVIRWQHLPQLAPFLWRFLQAASPVNVEKSARALAAVIPGAFDDYRPLIEAAGIGNMVQRHGELYVYESDAAYAGGTLAHNIRRSQGVPVQEIPLKDLYDLEPSLARIFKHAVLLPNSWQTENPYDFAAALAQDFIARGGRFISDSVRALRKTDDGGVEIIGEQQRYRPSKTVLALGVESRRFVRQLGLPVVLEAERGYHLTLHKPGVTLKHSVISGEYKFGLLPMRDALRLAGTAEYASATAKPDYDRSHRLWPLAKRIVPTLDDAAARSEWMGSRPSTPDSLPVIGRAPGVPSLYFAFGHGHSGLTLAASTGRIVADQIAARPTHVDVSPFSVTRFQ